jgi:hypothetical protein
VITLRQHAISLAAVFIALAIGVVLGSGLLNDTLLSGLRDDKRTQQRQIEGLNQQKNALNEKLNAASDFDATMAPRIVRDALAGRKVVLFTTPEADRSDVDALAELVSSAGGSVSARVGLTGQFADANQGERLRTIVNSPGGHPTAERLRRPGFTGRRSSRHRAPASRRSASSRPAPR